MRRTPSRPPPRGGKEADPLPAFPKGGGERGGPPPGLYPGGEGKEADPLPASHQGGGERGDPLPASPQGERGISPFSFGKRAGWQ